MMLIGRRRALGCIAAPLLGQTRKFGRSYFFQKDAAEGTFTDLAVGSDLRAWYAGVVAKEGRTDGCLVTTLDGGKTWTDAALKFLPASLFALDDSLLWAVSVKSELWFSNESGRTWRKLGRAKNVARVVFFDERRGFGVGPEKTFLKTEDGGKTWRYVPEGAQGPGDAKRFAYQQIDVFDGKRAIVSGSARTERPMWRRRLPDWMEPEMAALITEKPTVSVSLETGDSGGTWKVSSGSAFGFVSRIRMGKDGVGFSLVRFAETFEYGGELYLFGAGKKSERVLRRKDLYLHDVVYVPGDGVYVACTEKRGRVNLPIPMRVRVLWSKDFANWEEIAVDYRAAAQGLYLEAGPGGGIWLGTENGTVLRLGGG
jgi:hypothetical protein